MTDQEYLGLQRLDVLARLLVLELAVDGLVEDNARLRFDEHAAHAALDVRLSQAFDRIELTLARLDVISDRIEAVLKPGLGRA